MSAQSTTDDESSGSDGRGRVELGDVAFNPVTTQDFRLSVEGTSGTGKSNTLAVILEDLADVSIPTLIIERVGHAVGDVEGVPNTVSLLVEFDHDLIAGSVDPDRPRDIDGYLFGIGRQPAIIPQCLSAESNPDMVSLGHRHRPVRPREWQFTREVDDERDPLSCCLDRCPRLADCDISECVDLAHDDGDVVFAMVSFSILVVDSPCRIPHHGTSLVTPV